jgi:hypothetical protein
MCVSIFTRSGKMKQDDNLWLAFILTATEQTGTGSTCNIFGKKIVFSDSVFGI